MIARPQFATVRQQDIPEELRIQGLCWDFIRWCEDAYADECHCDWDQEYLAQDAASAWDNMVGGKELWLSTRSVQWGFKALGLWLGTLSCHEVLQFPHLLWLLDEEDLLDEEPLQ